MRLRIICKMLVNITLATICSQVQIVLKGGWKCRPAVCQEERETGLVNRIDLLCHSPPFQLPHIHHILPLTHRRHSPFLKEVNVNLYGHFIQFNGENL